MRTVFQRMPRAGRRPGGSTTVLWTSGDPWGFETVNLI